MHLELDPFSSSTLTLTFDFARLETPCFFLDLEHHRGGLEKTKMSTTAGGSKHDRLGTGYGQARDRLGTG